MIDGWMTALQVDGSLVDESDLNIFMESLPCELLI